MDEVRIAGLVDLSIDALAPYRHGVRQNAPRAIVVACYGHQLASGNGGNVLFIVTRP